MNRTELNIAVSAIKNLHEHDDHCVYDTDKVTLTQYCNVCPYKELKKIKSCTSHRIIEILDIED